MHSRPVRHAIAWSCCVICDKRTVYFTNYYKSGTEDPQRAATGNAYRFASRRQLVQQDNHAVDFSRAAHSVGMRQRRGDEVMRSALRCQIAQRLYSNMLGCRCRAYVPSLATKPLVVATAVLMKAMFMGATVETPTGALANAACRYLTGHQLFWQPTGIFGRRAATPAVYRAIRATGARSLAARKANLAADGGGWPSQALNASAESDSSARIVWERTGVRFCGREYREIPFAADSHLLTLACRVRS